MFKGSDQRHRKSIWFYVKEMQRAKESLHMIFINLEKTYDKMSRNVMWWALQKHKVSTK
jgi:hypothetical protein